MAIENSRFKTRKEREEEEKKRKASEERFVLPTYEELNAIEEKAKEDAARVASSEKGLDFFQRPSNWDDGYQFGDVTKTALGTLGDVGVNAVKGVVRMGEGIGDAAQYGAAALADLFGADEKAEAIRQNAQRDKVTEAFSGVDEKLNKYSVLGRTSDAAAESLGQIGAIVGTAGLAGALGAGAVGTTAATTGLMGLSSFGSGTGEAYAAGADEGEAEAYGAIAGAADALSEMIFGGLGKGFKALGLSKGITSADDVLAKAVTSKIRNTLAKNAVQLGIKAGAEGLEEVLAGTMQAAGKKATYMSERDFADIIKDENLLEQFVVGAMASGISQTPSFVSATRAGVDLVSNGADAASDSAQDVQEKFAALRDKNADFGEIERTGLASGAKEEDIRMAGELSTALGKKIRFFREDAKNGTINNGEYHEDTGEIWINTRSKNVKAQIVAHELTHSIEKKDGYQKLVDLTMNKLEEEQKVKGKTLDDLYREKETLYADGGVRLASYDEITSELVAEYVEKRLLTDEASIKSLVSENRTLGQRIREWFDSLLVKMGNASAKEREYIRQMRDVYARALGEDVSAETSADGKVRHSFVGDSANIDKSQLAVAKQMEADGKTDEEIYAKTGWYKQSDGKWRMEIMDEIAEPGNFARDGHDTKKSEKEIRDFAEAERIEAEAKALYESGEFTQEMYDSSMRYAASFREDHQNKGKLTKYLNAPKLFNAYPALENVTLEFRELPDQVLGWSFSELNEIFIDDKQIEKYGQSLEEVLAHEIQHFIQDMEGFEQGTNPEAAGSEEDYFNAGGEVEARDVMDRLRMSEEERRGKMPVRFSVSREDASVTEAETDQTLQQIRNDIAADEARYRELSDTVMSNERFNAMMPNEQNAILDEMQSLRERIDRANQIVQDMSYEQDMGDDVQMPTDEDVYQSTAEQGMYDDMEAEYAELIRDKRKEDADKRTKQKAKDRRVEERLNRQYEDALTWRFGDQTPISEERLMEDAQTVESMGEREFLEEQGFGYRDMMDQMDEDAAERYKEWRETQKQERAHLREVEDDLNRQFEQAEKERRELNRRQREEDRKRRIERGEIQTVAQRLEENLRSAQLERSDIDQMRRNASEEYQMIIDDIQERYDALKNKNTAEANTMLRRISRTESRARTEDEAYQKRIYDIDEKIGRIQSEIQRKESPTEQRNMRRDLHESILYRIKEAFSKRGFDLDKVLAKAKDLSTFATVDNTPQRVMEKSLGYKEGRELSDLTIDQAARNETEGIRWLNGFTDKKDGVLAKLSKKYNIKPGSKESAAAQMYAEGFYVSDKNEIVEYGDRELAADFPDAQVRENIKGLAHDPIIRQIYDETLDAINASRTRNAFPEIQKLDNYYLHFRAMDDTFSRLGIPFNPNDIRAKDLPTDLNGVTADLKPGQPYFASAKHRLGKRTSFDLLGGMEKYLTSAKNQIYHIDDIQTLRALRNYVADMYGQAEGLANLDELSDEEVEARIKDIYGSHLSTFAKFLNEEANVLAGKTSLIDRGLEGVIGRRGITFLNDVNRQVGANMVGYNISSSLTNFLAPVQAFAKMNKAAFVKGFAQTVENRMKSITGNGDDFAQKSDVIVRRKGADRFHRTAWQKMSDPGYLLMGMVDDISTEIIARAKYNELTAKGMDAETANRETDKWVSRLMGDRSLGQMPQIFNSKMLGLVTKFQLEVRNQLDSQFYDTIKEAQAQYEEIGDKAKRNAKTAAKVAATFAELALAQHVFGSVFESIAGYNPAFDIIEVIATVLGLDDDEESEDTVLDNIEQGMLALIEDLPYSSVILDGGRIPVGSAMPIGEIIKGQDEYGNDINRLKTVAEAVPYYALPGGYGQVKKTAKGLSMFSGDKAVTGSYTDSGNLRFPVEATPGNIAQAAVFGQWANENARDYFDNERKPANERQTIGYAESGLEWKEFQKYRDQISKLDRDADKLALIKSLDIDQTAKEALYRYLVASAKKDDDGNIIGSSEDERLAALYATGLRFSDYADAKLKQAELNADTGLTANQRATRFYAWAASEGYTDEQADAITEQFKFSSGFKVEPTQYKKLIGGGVSPENAVLVTDALSGASRAIDKINAVWSTGLTGKQLDNAVKAVVTEGWYERYRKVVDANVPLDVLTWVLDNADANGNDSIDNEERTLILSQLALSRKELSALWEATGGSEKSNPYSGNGGNKSGGIGVKIEMPKVEVPKIEMPKIELPKIGG